MINTMHKYQIAREAFDAIQEVVQPTGVTSRMLMPLSLLDKLLRHEKKVDNDVSCLNVNRSNA